MKHNKVRVVYCIKSEATTNYYKNIISNLKKSLMKDHKNNQTKRENKRKDNSQVVNRTRWSFKEDALLFALVQEFGPKHWSKIAEHIPRRTGKQCRERWLVRLNPENSTFPWTKEEDAILKHLHEQLGNQWSAISKEIKGRSTMQIKNRWKFLLHHDPDLKEEPLLMIDEQNQIQNTIEISDTTSQMDLPVENVFDVFYDSYLDISSNDSSYSCFL